MTILRGALTFIMVAALFLCGTISELQALEPVTETNVVKNVNRVERYVRLADNVIVLFDSSGSMGVPYGDSGMTKLEAAKMLLKQRTESYPDVFPELKTGLYSYTPPAVLDQPAKFEYYKIRPFNRTEWRQAVDELPNEASGPTLMVSGLRKLDNILAGLSGRSVVFMFTDGTHSDEGATESPLELAQKLAAKYDVNFQLISTTDDVEKHKLLEAVAAINESSRVYTFEDMLNRPELFTGAVFVIEESYVVSREAINEVVGFKLNDILFGHDKTEIKVQFTEELDDVGEILKKYPESYIVLSGHTDSQGTAEYNLGLSHRRVDAVAEYLAKHFNIDQSRIQTFWYGESSPAYSNDTPEGRRKNRRVVGFISGVSDIQ